MHPNEAALFFIGKGNNLSLVADVLEGWGWRRIPANYQFYADFDLKWVQLRSEIDFFSHKWVLTYPQGQTVYVLLKSSWRLAIMPGQLHTGLIPVKVWFVYTPSLNVMAVHLQFVLNKNTMRFVSKFKKVKEIFSIKILPYKLI